MMAISKGLIDDVIETREHLKTLNEDAAEMKANLVGKEIMFHGRHAVIHDVDEQLEGVTLLITTDSDVLHKSIQIESLTNL